MRSGFFSGIMAAALLAAPLLHAQGSFEPAPTLDGIPVFYNKVGRVTFGSDGSVRTDSVAPLTVPVLGPQTGSGTHVTLDNSAASTEGASFTAVGPRTIVGEGVTYKRLGNSIFGSDGSTYIELGGAIIGADGSRYVRSGERLVRIEAAK